jgi:hypothetical protein
MALWLKGPGQDIVYTALRLGYLSYRNLSYLHYVIWRQMGFAGYVSFCMQLYCVSFHFLSLHVSAYMAIFRRVGYFIFICLKDSASQLFCLCGSFPRKPYTWWGLHRTARFIERASVKSNTPNSLQAATPSADFNHESPGHRNQPPTSNIECTASSSA